MEIAVSQDYQDFAKGYGQRQKKKSTGGLVTSAITGVIGYFVGGYFSSRGNKKRNDKEKKDLLQYIMGSDPSISSLVSKISDASKETIEQVLSEKDPSHFPSDEQVS